MVATLRKTLLGREWAVHVSRLDSCHMEYLHHRGICDGFYEHLLLTLSRYQIDSGLVTFSSTMDIDCEFVPALRTFATRG